MAPRRKQNVLPDTPTPAPRRQRGVRKNKRVSEQQAERTPSFQQHLQHHLVSMQLPVCSAYSPSSSTFTADVKAKPQGSSRLGANHPSRHTPFQDQIPEYSTHFYQSSVPYSSCSLAPGAMYPAQRPPAYTNANNNFQVPTYTTINQEQGPQAAASAFHQAYGYLPSFNAPQSYTIAAPVQPFDVMRSSYTVADYNSMPGKGSMYQGPATSHPYQFAEMPTGQENLAQYAPEALAVVPSLPALVPSLSTDESAIPTTATSTDSYGWMGEGLEVEPLPELGFEGLMGLDFGVEEMEEWQF